MAPVFSDIVEEARLSARALLDYGEGFFNPTVRLGVTVSNRWAEGLSAAEAVTDPGTASATALAIPIQHHALGR